MSDRVLQYRRLHHLLLLQKHLALREGVSPFTLVLDSVEQSARPLTQRYIHNAKISKVDVIFVSYETLRPPPGVATFIKARRKDLTVVQEEITAALSDAKRNLLIIDTLYPLLHLPTLPTFLSSLLRVQSTTTLLAIYHLDIPSPTPISSYSPAPLALLTYLATAVFTVHSIHQTIARQRAVEKSLPEPAFGLAEEREGVVVGLLRGTGKDGLVLEAEFRRKSGRGVEEWFFVPPVSDIHECAVRKGEEKAGEAKLILLDDHPEYRLREGDGVDRLDGNGGEATKGDEADVTGSTFELGLTAKQRRDREGVVLPYFDAQKGRMGDAGDGGRILYEFGVEDDFDEEEDEI